MKTAQNLMHRQFGRLKVIGKSINKHNRIVWDCLCKCGNQKRIITGSLLREDGKGTRSCGCLQRERVIKANTKGYGEASLHGIYCVYKNNAKRRNQEFKLSKDEFKKLTKQNCNYCGTIPKQVITRGNSSTPYTYNGIDRVNNKKGYTIENSVSCCMICNMAKGALTHTEFKNWIIRIYNHTIG